MEDETSADEVVFGNGVVNGMVVEDVLLAGGLGGGCRDWDGAGAAHTTRVMASRMMLNDEMFFLNIVFLLMG